MPKLIIKDMKFGQQADGGIRENALNSFRRLVNYDIIFEGDTPRLRVRPGYERWNEVALPDLPLQLHPFVDMDDESHLIVRCDDNEWKEARETGAHRQISTFTATGQQPVTQYGNRLFLGTDGTDADDPGMIWTDHDSLYGATASYRMGIIRPSNLITATQTAPEGNEEANNGFIPLHDVGYDKVAFKYTNSGPDLEVSSVYVRCGRYGTLAVVGNVPGSFNVSIFDDNGGEPGSVVAPEAVSSWMPTDDFQTAACNYRRYLLSGSITLSSLTTYWVVVTPDDEYFRQEAYGVPIPNDYYCAVGTDQVGAPTHGRSMVYDDGTSTWWNPAPIQEGCFFFGGFEADKYYGYVTTFYNSTYAIESRPSEELRAEGASRQVFTLSDIPVSTDPQVDIVRIYRREMDDIDAGEDDITDEYKYVGEVTEGIGATLIDARDTDNLGSFLQTQDHYCLDETAEEGEEGRQSSIDPYCMCLWKGRAWVGEQGDNHLSFSKVFEEDGATNLTGLSSPDFFPLKNRIEIPEPGYPLDIYPLSNDQLAVYMSNETTYVIYGGNQPLNPPADFAIVPVGQTHGLIARAAFSPEGSKHWIMTRDGIWTLTGPSSAIMDYESEFNASIIKSIETQYLKITRVESFGNEIWFLLDFDNDGEGDTILILNLEREILSRGLYERSWRMYQYDTHLNDIAMLNTADEFREMYAADADNAYILKLNTGNQDHETDITAWFESHDLTAEDLAMIFQLDIDAYYPNEADIPTYTWTLTDHAGNTVSGTMTPTSNEDVRGHRSGSRLKRPISVRAKISQVSSQFDEIRAVVISHTGE